MAPIDAFLSFDLGTIDPVTRLDVDDRDALYLWPATAPPVVSMLKR